MSQPSAEISAALRKKESPKSTQKTASVFSSLYITLYPWLGTTHYALGWREVKALTLGWWEVKALTLGWREVKALQNDVPFFLFPSNPYSKKHVLNDIISKPKLFLYCSQSSKQF